MKRGTRVAMVKTWLLGIALAAGGCSGELITNLTEERGGSVGVIFINNTAYRASFSYGTYDSLDRVEPGAVDFAQQRVTAGTSSETDALECRRNFAIGTDEFLQRVIDLNEDEGENFDADAFVTVVNFSDAPEDSSAAALPTVGTALGREVLLGVDYRCGDLLIFTFEEDAEAPGGFRIDFTVVPTSVDQQPGGDDDDGEGPAISI